MFATLPFVSNHIIDYADVDKFNKKHGSQAPQISLHEAAEAYEAALRRIGGRPTERGFQRIHDAAIVFENVSRSRVPGLGQRIGEGPVLNPDGTQKMEGGYPVVYIDYTTHVETYNVDLQSLTVIQVKVEKKPEKKP